MICRQFFGAGLTVSKVASICVTELVWRIEDRRNVYACMISTLEHQRINYWTFRNISMYLRVRAYLHEKRANCICSNEVNRYEMMRQTDKWNFNHFVRTFLMSNIFSHYLSCSETGWFGFRGSECSLRMKALIIERSQNLGKTPKNQQSFFFVKRTRGKKNETKMNGCPQFCQKASDSYRQNELFSRMGGSSHHIQNL